jgi:hypothetical protein
MPMIQTDSQHYTDIADAIRAQNESQDVYYPADMAAAIRSLPNGDVDDVQMNGQSIVSNKIASFNNYVELTQYQYDQLPSSKLTDNILYCIKDADVTPVTFLSGITAPSNSYGANGNLYIMLNAGGTVMENIYFKVNTTWVPMITNGNTVGW